MSQVEAEAAAAAQTQVELHSQLTEQATELAAARVEAENKGAQASALSAQLYELQVCLLCMCVAREGVEASA